MNSRRHVMMEIAALDQTRIIHQLQLNENKRYLSRVLYDNSLVFLLVLASAFLVGWRNGRPSHVSSLFKQLEQFFVLTLMANIKKKLLV